MSDRVVGSVGHAAGSRATRRLLVCGGAGFIGSQYVRALAAGLSSEWSDPAITVLDRLTYAGNLSNLASAVGRYRFVRGDIRNPEVLSAVVPGHEVVINFAAESHVDRSIHSARAFIESNVLGTQSLMQACLDAGVSMVIQVSTDEVYGSIASGSWDENTPLAPTSPYAASKAGGDLIALSYWRTHGLPVCVTRCCNNYGPFQYPEKFIPFFITRLLDGLKVPLYGDGSNVRQWIHVADHCRAVQLVAERGTPGEVYHIAGDIEVTNKELTSRLLKELNVGWDRVMFVEDRMGHDFRYSVSDSKMRGLGYKPSIDFEVGLAETVRWYRENRDWWPAGGPPQ